MLIYEYTYLEGASSVTAAPCLSKLPVPTCYELKRAAAVGTRNKTFRSFLTLLTLKKSRRVQNPQVGAN